MLRVVNRERIQSKIDLGQSLEETRCRLEWSSPSGITDLKSHLKIWRMADYEDNPLNDNYVFECEGLYFLEHLKARTVKILFCSR